MTLRFFQRVLTMQAGNTAHQWPSAYSEPFWMVRKLVTVGSGFDTVLFIFPPTHHKNTAVPRSACAHVDSTLLLADLPFLDILCAR